ncbi:DNA damage-regulated autophagy modulator protein 1 isoform X1 [Lingula anatina]|uniref:DNA damage-regulated autophagy modulator protein 1 isoform X1 n=1 Tax=Lingula anatina TaxID=7574 RepID=A0A1S3HID0_LINAN|nr:DNA damage-regulated autophagy modulator protein 1 isoform X1 [Lingula anatina]|eukprot:XP_013385752.1 DNA damage-regulated autophagy modulator protein 1 isoform X1 [Lingula anatina]
MESPDNGVNRTVLVRKSRWHLLPLALFIIMPVTFVVSYVVAVLNNHVYPAFPYISDTGSKAPESCIFGQLLNLCAVLVGLIVYLRFKQLKLLYGRPELSIILMRVNLVAFITGLIAAFGVTMVANFQESSAYNVHMFGALMTFGCGLSFCGLHTVLSYKLCPLINPRWLCHVRCILTLVTLLFMILMFVAGVLSLPQFSGSDKNMWSPDIPGYDVHVISTSSEWVMAMGLLGFFLTFMFDFRNFRVKAPKLFCDMAIPDVRYQMNGEQIAVDHQGMAEDTAMIA